MMSPATVSYPNHAPLQPVPAIDLLKESVNTSLWLACRDQASGNRGAQQLH